MVASDFLERHTPQDKPVSLPPVGVPPGNSAALGDGSHEHEMQLATEASLLGSTNTGEPPATKPVVTETIEAVDHPEPDGSDPLITKVQIRLKGGNRIVRPVLKSDKVRVLYEALKFKLPELQDPELKQFELILAQTSETTLNKLDLTVEEAQLCGVQLLLSYPKE